MMAAKKKPGRGRPRIGSGIKVVFTPEQRAWLEATANGEAIAIVVRAAVNEKMAREKRTHIAAQ